jgi:hypothetical protein
VEYRRGARGGLASQHGRPPRRTSGQILTERTLREIWRPPQLGRCCKPRGLCRAERGIGARPARSADRDARTPPIPGARTSRRELDQEGARMGDAGPRGENLATIGPADGTHWRRGAAR